MSAKDRREFAEMQHNRGRAYSLLQAGDKRANLKRAIACYEKALQVYTREDYPKEWAALQYDLGDTHHNLPGGERQANLQAAIACYEQALQVYTPEDGIWAMIQLRLGDAYRDLPGKRQDYLQQAIQYYQNALQVYTRTDFPAAWARTQSSLGEAFRNLPQGDQQVNLENAFACYQAILQVYTCKSFPKEWAGAQRSLGDLYRNLPDERQFGLPYQIPPPPVPGASDRHGWDQQTNLRNAIFCYQAALQVYTHEDFPTEWASTKYALGNAYSALHGDDRQANLEQAIACYRNALLVYTLESAPIEWAQTQHSLGDGYRDLLGGDRRTTFELASDCYEKALQVYTQQDFPNEWSAIQNNLKSMQEKQPRDRLEQARALRSVGDVQIFHGQPTAALQSYYEALAIFRQLREHGEEARTLGKIGNIQVSSQHEAAMQNYARALVLFQQIGDVAGEASALLGMGNVDRANARENYQLAEGRLQRMRYSEVSGFFATGDAYCEAARQNYEQALSLFQQAGDSLSVDIVHRTLNDLKLLREQRERMQGRLAEQRASNDIRATLAISREEALNGTQRTLTLPGGRRISVFVPAGAHNGQIISLPNVGEPMPQDDQAGLLILTIAVQSPAASPAAQSHEESFTPPLSRPTTQPLGGPFTLPTLTRAASLARGSATPNTNVPIAMSGCRSRPITAASIGAAATIIAAIIGGLIVLQNASAPYPNATPTPGGSTPFTCTSGSLCQSFPMTIQNTLIMIHQDNTSTWSFQITNTGNQTLDEFLLVRIGDASMQYGQVRLNPNETVPIAVTVRFTPSNNAVIQIALVFNDTASGQHFAYSQSCTYSASQNTCQA